MNGKKIVIEISWDGKIEVKAEGYTGKGCVEAVRGFSEALGLEAETENLPEFYLTAGEETGLTIGGDR